MANLPLQLSLRALSQDGGGRPLDLLIQQGVRFDDHSEIDLSALISSSCIFSIGDVRTSISLAARTQDVEPEINVRFLRKTRRKFSLKRIDVLLALVILALAVTNVILIRQNRSLKAAMPTSQPESLQQGTHLPSFAANTTSGERRKVDFSASEKTVLLVFQADCPACEGIVPLWKDIKLDCDRRHFQIFGISFDNQAKANSFLKGSGLDLESFAGLDASFKNRYGLHETPLTIVIDRAGIVEKLWVGLLDKETGEKARNYFRSL